MGILNIEEEIISEDSRIRPKNSEVLHLVSDNKKAEDLINWKPEVDFTSGLERTIEFIKDNLEIFRTDSYNI